MPAAANALHFFTSRAAAAEPRAATSRTYRGCDGIGFRRGSVGTHTSRTIMLADLASLFAAMPAAATDAIVAETVKQANCRGKATASTRRLTHQRLTELYALDPSVPLYRVLRRLWPLDPAARPLLAVTVALARDPLLAASAAVFNRRQQTPRQRWPPPPTCSSSSATSTSPLAPCSRSPTSPARRPPSWKTRPCSR